MEVNRSIFSMTASVSRGSNVLRSLSQTLLIDYTDWRNSQNIALWCPRQLVDLVWKGSGIWLVEIRATMNVENNVCVATLSCLPVDKTKFVAQTREVIKLLDDLRVARRVVFRAKTKKDPSRGELLWSMFCHVALPGV
jgi:hypothetical protein